MKEHKMLSPVAISGHGFSTTFFKREVPGKSDVIAVNLRLFNLGFFYFGDCILLMYLTDNRVQQNKKMPFILSVSFSGCRNCTDISKYYTDYKYSFINHSRNVVATEFKLKNTEYDKPPMNKEWRLVLPERARNTDSKVITKNIFNMNIPEINNNPVSLYCMDVSHPRKNKRLVITNFLHYNVMYRILVVMNCLFSLRILKIARPYSFSYNILVRINIMKRFLLPTVKAI